MGSFKTSSSLIICFPWSGLQPSNPLSRWKDFTDCVSSMDIPMFSGPSNNSCTQSLDLRTRRRKNKSDEITVMECRIPRAMWSNCNSLEHHTFFDKYRYPPPLWSIQPDLLNSQIVERTRLFDQKSQKNVRVKGVGSWRRPALETLCVEYWCPL